ncbi:tetratricopeptide repeat protein [Crenothrix sp.]|uniref:tetratricopeptide repeat protein n=1 Tax=Crenothrix sp. TaxID=3100433 RepID=UPI00374CB2F6
MLVFTGKNSFGIVGILMLLGLTNTICAKPYIPQSSDEILEQLPLLNNRTDKQLQQLQRQLSAEPNNLQVASAVANRFIELARSESDPRYYGYAEAAVQKWWRQPEPPISVLMIRANLRQHRHDFEAALRDLRLVITENPSNGQAWLSLAVIQSVQGNYEDARISCLHLKRLSSHLTEIACLSNAASLSGSAQQAYALLKQTVENTSTPDTEIQRWALTLLAEIAVRLGDDKAAETHFLQALALNQRDVYLLSSYCDFLLDQGRSKQVIELLKNDTRPDSLLLRLALAEQIEGTASLTEHQEEMQQRIEAYRLRDENIHQREEARFYLELLKQPKEALKLALQNWQVQREPADARLVIDAALACQDRVAAQPLLAWLKEKKLQDKILQQHVAQLEQGS